jgi:HicA toxin of bacterial toxin-antitoxin,
LTPKLPTATANDLVRDEFRPQNGSHAIYVRARDQARVVIPMHRGELKRKTLRTIIEDLQITIAEFTQML